MAKIFLDPADSITISNNNISVFGSTGTETITVAQGVTGTIFDQNTEKVLLSGSVSSFKFVQAGNQVKVFDSTGATLVATVPVQGDTDGTALTFTDGTAQAILSGGIMKIGGATVNATTAATVTPTTFDITVKTPITTPTTPTFSIAAGAASVTEGNNATFTVTLSAAQAAATTVNFAVAGTGNATLGTDTGTVTATGATLSGSTLTFPAGTVTATVIVPVAFDTAAETGEGVSLTLSVPSTGISLGSNAVAVTAFADPAAPTFTLTSNAVAGAANEEGSTITYTVTPSGVTDKAYTFTLTTIGDTVGGVATAGAAADFSPASQTVTFAAGTSVAQTVVQTIVNDGTIEGLEGYKTSLIDSLFASVSSKTGLVTDPTSGTGSGTTYTLTTSIDNVPGTNGNDTILAEANTASNGDQVAGGSGSDTFKLYGGAGSADIPTISGVEVFDLVDFTTTTDFSAITDLTTLKFNNATSGTTFTAAAAVNFQTQGMADGETITFASTTTDTSHNITVTDMGTIAGAGVTVNADGAAVTTVNIENSGTIAAGTDSRITLASTGTESTVNVTGSGDLALTTAASVVTLGASAFTGNLTYISGATTTATAITTGSGNDSVTATAAVDYTIKLAAGDDLLTTADAAGELTIADSIDGGAGTDTLGIATAEALNLDDGDTADKAVLAKVTGFEQLRITDTLTAGPLAINNLGFNYVQLTTALGAGVDATINGFSSGMTFESLLNGSNAAGDDYIIGMTGATGAGTNSDTINIRLNANLITNDQMNLIGFDLAGINIVNIASLDSVTSSNPDTDADGDEGYTVNLAGGTAANSANITTVNVTGAQKVAYTVNASTSALATYDGSAATGEQDFTGTAFAGTQGIVIKGGSNTDTLIGTTLADVINGGAGKDTISGGDGADVLTGGDGADTFQFVAGDLVGVPSSTNFDAIADYAKNVDIIDFTAGNLVIIAGSVAASGTAGISAKGFATFNAADDTLAKQVVAVEAGINSSGAAAARQFAVWESGTSSYVFVSDGTDGVDANDVLIQLTGVTGLTTTDIVTSAGDLILS